jgi:IS4 transposase
VFAQYAQRQYVRELLFSTTVELMSLVAVGLRPSLHAAAQAAGAALPVSITALYDKVNGTEPALVRALVAGSAQRLAPVMAALQHGKPALASGWRLRILDGSHLAGSERRIKPLRGYRGAALPGQSLVVFDPDSALVVDVVPAEDAHVQERLLMPALLLQAQRGELWLADCNFSTRAILGGWAAQGACFIVREHGANPHPTPCGPSRPCGRIDTGTVSEQPVETPVPEGCSGESQPLRHIELALDVPTEDGDTGVRLLTNLAPEAMDACTIARLYRRRWSIECLFQRLEAVLHSEVASPGTATRGAIGFWCGGAGVQRARGAAGGRERVPWRQGGRRGRCLAVLLGRRGPRALRGHARGRSTAGLGRLRATRCRGAGAGAAGHRGACPACATAPPSPRGQARGKEGLRQPPRGLAPCRHSACTGTRSP